MKGAADRIVEKFRKLHSSDGALTVAQQQRLRAHIDKMFKRIEANPIESISGSGPTNIGTLLKLEAKLSDVDITLDVNLAESKAIALARDPDKAIHASATGTEAHLEALDQAVERVFTP